MRSLHTLIMAVATVAFASAAIAQCNRIDASAIDGCTPDAFQVRYASNLNKGDSLINITNTGTTQSGSTAANICVNVYAFGATEEMVSCCSCLVTPNALVSLSVQGDLISNTLSPATPTAVVVKLVATETGTGNSCNPGRENRLARGMRAWGTTLHALPTVPVSYGLTETRFLEGGLSQKEWDHVTAFCGFINANGSGFGICKSCRSGGLGGAKEE